MKNRKVYIFNSASRAANYGIGTYISQLTSCLKKTDISFDVIYLNGEGKEVTVTEEKGYRRILIPAAQYRNKREVEYYYRNVAYLLDEYIIQDKYTECIFHLNFMTNPLFVSSLKKRYKCKVILTCHYTNWSFSLLGDEKRLLAIAKDKTQRKSLVNKQYYNELKEDIEMIKKCDRFVCVAEHSLNTFLKIIDIEKDKYKIINNAIRDEYKELTYKQKQILKAKWWIADHTRIILFVGRLDEVKGVNPLINAFKKLLQTHPDTHLILAGDGEYNQLLIEASECCTKITFTGRLCKKKIQELYQIADIGVVPSIHEEFGLVAIEMMMHKLPIIVGNTGGLSEIIKDNITGLKVPIKTLKGKRTISPQFLSSKIRLLLEDGQYASNIAENGRKVFLEKYEISSFRSKILTLYKSL